MEVGDEGVGKEEEEKSGEVFQTFLQIFFISKSGVLPSLPPCCTYAMCFATPSVFCLVFFNLLYTDTLSLEKIKNKNDTKPRA